MIVLYLLVLAVMLSAGIWQLARAAEKRAVLDAAALAREAAPGAVPAVAESDAAARAFRRVAVRGRYLPERQFLWDNRTRQGQAGYEVITPLRLAPGVAGVGEPSVVLVNRGWVPLGTSRERLPDVALAADFTDVELSLVGLWSRPSRGFAGGDAVEATDAWPRRLQYLDYTAIASALAEPVAAGVLQPQTREQPLDRADMLPANWEPTLGIGPMRHYGYAAQWFAMALALTVLFIILNMSKTGDK